MYGGYSKLISHHVHKLESPCKNSYLLLENKYLAL